MTRLAKSRMQRLVVIGAVALAVALLLLRMFVFVQGHGRRGRVGGGQVSITSKSAAINGSAWTDS
jgi:hypothetical protein